MHRWSLAAWNPFQQLSVRERSNERDEARRKGRKGYQTFQLLSFPIHKRSKAESEDLLPSGYAVTDLFVPNGLHSISGCAVLTAKRRKVCSLRNRTKSPRVRSKINWKGRCKGRNIYSIKAGKVKLTREIGWAVDQLRAAEIKDFGGPSVKEITDRLQRDLMQFIWLLKDGSFAWWWKTPSCVFKESVFRVEELA